MDFEKAFEILIGHEGGYQNDYADRGNWTSGLVGKGKRVGTNYGITAMTYPHVDIKNLSLDEAKEIYKRDFWERLRLDELPPALGFQLFDAAVNSGVGNAARFLQGAVGAVKDGHIGVRTLSLASQFEEHELVARFNGERLRFMTNLSVWNKYGKGWARRIASNLLMES